MVRIINKQEKQMKIYSQQSYCYSNFRVELNSDTVKPRTANNPIIAIGTMAFLKLKISNKRHKTPNPIIAINVFIF